MSAAQQMLLAGGGPINYVLPAVVSSELSATTSSSFSLSALAGAVADDIVIVFTYTSATSTTLVGAQGSNGSGKVRYAWKRLTGADSTDTVMVNGHSAGAFTRAIKMLIRGASLDATPIASDDAGSASGTNLAIGNGGTPLVNNTLFVGGGGYITTAGTASASGFSGIGKTNIATRNPASFSVSGGTGYFVVVTADCVDGATGGNLSGTTSQTISSGSAMSARIKGLPA